MDITTIHNNHIERLVDFYSTLMISKFHTENNKTFIKKILTFILQDNPYILQEYYNYQIAEGEHLTKLADTLAGISRFVDGINLTDDELKLLIAFKLIKDRTKFNSFFDLKELIYSFFGNNINITCGYHSIAYFLDLSIVNSNLLKPILKYRLLPIPTDAYSVSVIKFDKSKKYVYFPPVEKYNLDQAPMSSPEDATLTAWLSPEDFISYS